MSRTVRGFVAGALCLLVATTAIANGLPSAIPLLRELGRTVPYRGGVGNGGYGIADFDGDGLDDIVVSRSGCSSYYDGWLRVVGARQDKVQTKQAILIEHAEPCRIVAWDAPSGDAQLLTITGNGDATVWAGWPLTATRQFNLGAEIEAVAIADVDVDGQLEIVTISSDSLAVYDLTSAALTLSLPYGGNDISVAQLDADLALELVIAGIPGRIIDGATHEVDWTYAVGFGTSIAAGAIGPQAASGFVADVANAGLTVFPGDPWSPLWNIDIMHAGSFTIADVHGDGQAEILVVDTQRGAIDIYDSDTHVVSATIAGPERYGGRIAVIELFGGGSPLVMLQKYPGDNLAFADPASGNIVAQIPVESQGPYTAVAMGNMDNDDAVELAYGADGAFSNDGATGAITILDASSGEIEWRSPADWLDDTLPFNLQPTVMKLLGNQLVVAGYLWYTGRIVSMNTESHEVAWRVGSDNSGPMRSRIPTDMASWDFNSDGVEDIIVSTETKTTFTAGMRLFVFSGVDGAELWHSVAIGYDFEPSYGVVVGDTGSGFGTEMIAVISNGLYAFNVQTRLLDWTLPVAAQGAALLDSAAAGTELVVFNGDTLSFYDGATRNFLRSFVVDGEITAIHELGDTRQLLVAVDGHLLIIDVDDGTLLAQSPYLGSLLGLGNQLATIQTGPDNWLIGVGNYEGVFRYRYVRSENIFEDGFDGSN